MKSRIEINLGNKTFTNNTTMSEIGSETPRKDSLLWTRHIVLVRSWKPGVSKQMDYGSDGEKKKLVRWDSEGGAS